MHQVEMSAAAHKLSMFNVRAHYLDESRFIKWLNDRGQKQPDMQRLLAGEWLVFEGLHREDLDSFFLNLRLLIQDRDGYSVRCLAKIYDEFPEDYVEAKEAFAHVRGRLNSFLRQSAKIRMDDKTELTNLDLLETYLYGGFAHNAPKHFENFLKATQSGIFSLFSFTAFWNVVTVLNQEIQKIALLNAEVIGWEVESHKPA